MFNLLQLPFIFQGSVNLSDAASAIQASRELCGIAMPLIQQIQEAIQAGTFAFDPWTFDRNPNSGLTNRVGLYLIVNRQSGRIYLGSSKNLALRKADYSRNLKQPERLYNSMQTDLRTHGRASFYFIPLVVFDITQVVPNNTTRPDSGEATVNQTNAVQASAEAQVVDFLDQKVEATMLSHYLSPACPFSALFYNTAIVGRFLPGNTRGGAPNSGTAPRGVAIGDVVAWESKVTWGDTLGRDRKLCDIKVKRGFMREITAQEFATFPGTRIPLQTREEFFKRPENRDLLLHVLNCLNLRKKPSEPGYGG
jgi:hypothetical protein